MRPGACCSGVSSGQMDSEAVAGLIGVVLGAALATVGTWLVSTWLERRRDDRRLYGVIGLLSEELKNNQHRIEAHRDRAKREDWRGVLTLGDWDANKAAFSQLVRDDSLWDGVVGAYGAIFEAISGRRDPPEPEELDALTGRLVAERKELARRTRVGEVLRAPR